jgi:hypothetical protein
MCVCVLTVMLQCLQHKTTIEWRGYQEEQSEVRGGERTVISTSLKSCSLRPSNRKVPLEQVVCQRCCCNLVRWFSEFPRLSHDPFGCG